nr:unnamed protein product [Callosobruchus analis]
MTDEFDSIKAPRFYDFTLGEDSSDSYFDEKDVTDPLETTDEQEQNEHFYTPGSNQMRRSMSQGDVHFLQTALQGLLIYRNNEEYEKHKNAEHKNDVETVEVPVENGVEAVKDAKIQTCKEKEKGNSIGKIERTSRSQVKYNTTRHKTASLDRLQALSKPKYLPNHSGRDYIPMAEMISKMGGHFRDFQVSNMWHGGKPKLTNPHTPKLLTTGRTRPVHIESAAEKELKQVEEMQRFKFKAKPVNDKLIHGPVKAVHLEKKPTTIPEPFHLTEIKHKPVGEFKVEVPEFHAKPVPKSVLEGPKKIDMPLKVTIPHTPHFTPSQEGGPKSRPSSPAYQKKRTQPVPFSFEVRDQMLKRKKEKMIEKVYEEMKKAREFHARPIPKAVLDDNRKSSTSSTKSLVSC